MKQLLHKNKNAYTKQVSLTVKQYLLLILKFQITGVLCKNGSWMVSNNLITISKLALI